MSWGVWRRKQPETCIVRQITLPDSELLARKASDRIRQRWSLKNSPVFDNAVSDMLIIRLETVTILQGDVLLLRQLRMNAKVSYCAGNKMPIVILMLWRQHRTVQIIIETPNNTRLVVIKAKNKRWNFTKAPSINRMPVVKGFINKTV